MTEAPLSVENEVPIVQGSRRTDPVATVNPGAAAASPPDYRLLS